MSTYDTRTGSQPGQGGTDPDTATGTAPEKEQEAAEVAREKAHEAKSAARDHVRTEVDTRSIPIGKGAEVDDKTVMRPIDHVRGEINGEFRSAREIAERLGMAVQVVGPPLGMLRRHGEVELMYGPSGECLWREASGGGLHGARSTERAGAVGDDR